MWDGIDKNGKATGGSKILDEGNLRVSIPYFADGQVIEIFDAKSDELVMSIDVSSFANSDLEDRNNQ